MFYCRHCVFLDIQCGIQAKIVKFWSHLTVTPFLLEIFSGVGKAQLKLILATLPYKPCLWSTCDVVTL